MDFSTRSEITDNALTRKEIPSGEFAPEAENVQLRIHVDRARTSLLAIRTTVDVTIKTNSSGSPDDTILISGGKPFLWHREMHWRLDDFLSADITDMFITNNDTESAGSVEIVMLGDATINE